MASNSPHSSSCCEINLNRYFYLLTATERLYWLKGSPWDLNRIRFLQGVEDIPTERDPKVMSFNLLILQMKKQRPWRRPCLGSTQDKMENSHKVQLLDQTSRNNKSEKRKKNLDCSSDQSLSKKNLILIVILLGCPGLASLAIGDILDPECDKVLNELRSLPQRCGNLDKAQDVTGCCPHRPYIWPMRAQ